jgi:hypothetical protein
MNLINFLSSPDQAIQCSFWCSMNPHRNMSKNELWRISVVRRDTRRVRVHFSDRFDCGTVVVSILQTCCGGRGKGQRGGGGGMVV